MLILNRNIHADAVPTLVTEIAQLERRNAALLSALAEMTADRDRYRRSGNRPQPLGDAMNTEQIQSLIREREQRAVQLVTAEAWQRVQNAFVAGLCLGAVAAVVTVWIVRG